MNLFETDQSHLVTKYDMNNSPDPDNAIANGTLTAERTMARAARVIGDTSWLLDPAYNEDMWKLANETMTEHAPAAWRLCGRRVGQRRVPILPRPERFPCV